MNKTTERIVKLTATATGALLFGIGTAIIREVDRRRKVKDDTLARANAIGEKNHVSEHS